MKKYIIAGANGFVGSSLIRRLIRRNIAVIAIDHSFARLALPESRLVTRVESDFSDLDGLKARLAGEQYECFYNFAWRGVNGPDKAKYEIQINNVALSLRCAELAKFLGCKKYLCAGTVAEYAIQSLPELMQTSGGMMYGAAKFCNRIMLETYCKNIGLDYVWMIFSNIYGPNNRTGNLISYTIDQLQKNEPAIFGPAQQPYDFIFIDDLIYAISHLGSCETKRNYYFIGSGAPRILADYLSAIGDVAGKKELIRIGERPDDGIKYRFEMLDAAALYEDIGPYISGDFEQHIKFTIEQYGKCDHDTEI